MVIVPERLRCYVEVNSRLRVEPLEARTYHWLERGNQQLRLRLEEIHVAGKS